MIDFDKTLFNIDIQSGNPRAGSLLIAEPFLREEYFRHAVISMIDYAEGSSAMGVVLNRRTAYSLQSLLSEVTREEPIEVFCGGPMSYDRLFYLHTLGNYITGSRQIANGLYVGGDFDQIISYVNDGMPIEGCVRFFVGYSGWSPHQLEEEISNKVWAVTDPDSPSELMRGEEDPYWHRYVRSLGKDFRGWLYHPRNPHAN